MCLRISREGKKPIQRPGDEEAHIANSSGDKRPCAKLCPVDGPAASESADKH